MEGADLDQKIQDVFRKIQTEQVMLEAMKKVSRATNNQDVLRKNEAQIREAERSLQYFHETLRDLQARKAQPDVGRSPVSPPPSSGPQPPRNARMATQTSHSTTDLDPSRSQSTTEGTERPKQYSNLDLIRAETPLNAAKISRMLHQLEFKLQVEKQYKAGIDKMTRAYQADGDRRSRVDTEAKRVESDRKIALLSAALKRYKTLHVLDVADDEEEEEVAPVDGQRKENMRNKPLSGKLQIVVQGARDLEHTPLVNVGKSRSSSKKALDTFVNVKVEGTQQARSHPSRMDRWMEEFEIPVDKANEIEIAIYDKQVGEVNPVPIGMLWIRISDLVEAIRRRKVLVESGQGGWVTAGAMPGSNGGFGQAPMTPGGDMNAPVNYPAGGAQGPPSNMAGAPQVEGIDGWFAVEPAGALALRLNFVKENVRKRALDRPGGLGRQGAVRARKDEVHEMNGHKFVQRQFYQIILCAFCGEFLLNAIGYQCEDCKYTCHKKCYEKVVTKCISKSNVGEDEEKINHRIPHRFEPLTNIGANWCCHCGQMLPLGRKNARKCSECDITCHANCAHLVPDFCGMSMETANQLLRNLRVIKSQQDAQGRPQPTKQPSHRPSGSMTMPSGGPAMGQLNQAMGGMRLEPMSPAQAQQQPDTGYQRQPQSPPMGAMNVSPQDPRFSQYSQQPGPPYQQQQQQQQQASSMPPRPPPGARMAGPGPQGGYMDPSIPQRPPPGYDQQQPMLPPGSDLDGSGSLGFDPNVQPALPPKPYPPPGVMPSTPARPNRTSTTLPMSPSQPLQPPPPSKPAGQPLAMGQSPVTPQSSMPASPAMSMAQPTTVAKSGRRRRVGLDDFNFLAVLGKGNFGKVMLAEEKKTNGLYAIKVLKKEFIIENDEMESTRSEKRVFMTASRERHPFLLDLHSCFQTETRVYFVMEYVSGGDLMLHIQRKQFSLRQAKFYACEVLLALEYFHANGIVYRDLKLDNILLTLDGHVKVADYGLCKEDMWFGDTTATFCGTPEFMAPEILLEKRYGRAVDWWAFGVLMYEMLLGQSPFRGDDEDEIFDAILEDEPLYPITMPRDAVAILQKLLTRDPARRLGSGKTDAEEIKKQPFFKDVNWDDVFNKRISISYFPTINGNADTSNFDEEFTKEQPTLTPVHGQLSARDQAEFNGFSWVAAWADI